MPGPLEDARHGCGREGSEMVDPNDLSKFLELFQDTPPLTLISIAVFAFGSVCLVKLYKAPEGGRPSAWPLVGFSLALGLLVAIHGMAWWVASRTPSVTTPEQAFKALQENKRVFWLIRLIPYSSQSEPHLSILNLTSLGPPRQQFVFVSDYDELKNMTVAEAVYRTGLSMTGGRDRVSAIIFPLHGELFPASARGVLRVFRKIDERMSGRSDVEYKPYDAAKQIRSDALEQLEKDGLPFYAWDNYSLYYDYFEQQVNAARKSRVDALSYIGEIGKDWHPAGYSEIIDGRHVSAMENKTFKLKTATDKEVELKNFGARIFLVENIQLSDIKKLMLIQFNNPETDRIPEWPSRAIPR